MRIWWIATSPTVPPAPVTPGGRRQGMGQARHGRRRRPGGDPQQLWSVGNRGRRRGALSIRSGRRTANSRTNSVAGAGDRFGAGRRGSARNANHLRRRLRSGRDQSLRLEPGENRIGRRGHRGCCCRQRQSRTWIPAISTPTMRAAIQDPSSSVQARLRRSHNKLGFSTFGDRVDVHAWGQSVASTGYGGLAEYGGDRESALHQHVQRHQLCLQRYCGRGHRDPELL